MLSLSRFPLNLPVIKIFLSFFFYLTVFISFFQNMEGAYIDRFVGQTFNGGISYTGNTVGLSKRANQNNPGELGSIGAFTSVNASLKVNNFPQGTTLSINNNSSSAVLDLPPNSEVVYAELVISGSYGWPAGNPPPPPANNVSITLTAPNSITTMLTCDPATAQNSPNSNFPNSGVFVRSVEVTNAVIAGGAGTYTVRGVPGTVAASEDDRNASAWTLAVIYKNPNMNTNNINFWVACEESTPSSNTPKMVSGFCAPDSGPISARLFVSAVEGDATIRGDRLLFGSTLPLDFSSDALSGINNPVNNFFCSQINTLVTISTDSNGKLVPTGPAQLDTRGTFGNRNQNALTATNISGGRQGQDITSIDISNKISNGQTSAYILGATEQDVFTISSLAIQIQVGAPIIAADKTVNGSSSIIANVGDIVTFSTNFTNGGSLDAENVIFRDILPAGLSFVPGSIVINDEPNLSATPSDISLPNLMIGDSVSVTFTARIEQFPSNSCLYTNTASLEYQFFQCSQSTPTTLTVDTNPITINLQRIGPVLQVIKNVDVTTATIGDIVTYTITLNNMGDTNADLVTIQDILPTGLNFVPGSVIIDGSPSTDTPASISVGELFANAAPVVVTFQAEVIASPSGTDCTFSNFATVSYTYTNCDNEEISDSINSNDIAFIYEISGSQLLAVKTANPLSAKLNDIITFTIELTNQSLETATDVFFQDILPLGLTFQSGSVTIDGVPMAMADPNSGFSGNDIPSGSTMVIQFDALATAFPFQSCRYLNTGTVNYRVPCSEVLSVNTNQVIIPFVSTGFLIATKEVTPSFVKVDDYVTFTINVFNNGDLPTSSVHLRDILQDGLIFIPESLTWNGTTISTPNLNNVSLPNLAPGGSATIQFKAIVSRPPQGGCLYNNLAYIDYTYFSCEDAPISKTAQTNVVPFNVEGITDIQVEKFVNFKHSTEVSLGDTVTFSIDVKNKGTNSIRYLIFKDILDSDLSFVPGSFSINGILQPDPNFATGVLLDDLFAEETIYIEFKANVTRIPRSGRLNNYATFDYVAVDPCSGNTFAGQINTNIVSILFEHPDPDHFFGKVQKCKFLNRTEYKLIANWTSPSLNVLFYRIYYEGKVIATISARDKLFYKKCICSKQDVHKFKLAAVYVNNLESRRIKLRIVNE